MSTETKNYHILVIEDNSGMRLIVSRRLRGQGMEVTAVGSAEEALKALSDPENDFDLVLLDYLLPDSNAENIVAEHWERLGNPPFIVLTGFGDERVAVKLMKLGAEDYITKDADFVEHLQSAVERTLRHVAGQRELKAAERQLKESEERLNLAIRSAGIAVWDINLAEETAIVDERWRKVSGADLPANPVPLKKLFLSIHPEDFGGFIRRWRSFLQHKGHGPDFETLFRLENPNVGSRWIECQAIQVSAAGKAEPLRAVCSLHDVTDRINIQEMEEQLRHIQGLDTLGAMVGGIAHDFNNVLASIIGYNELTMRHPSNEESVLANAKYIERATQRARHIIKQILLFTRRGETEIEQVDLVSLVDEAVGFIRAVVPPDVQLLTEYEIDSAIISADAGQISQVITNLLSNAAYAMKGREGAIQVRVFSANVASAEDCSPQMAGKTFVVQVEDDGPGVPEKIRERIFDPFFSTKPRDEGNGLGLATSLGIINSHGGKLELDSSRQGACFCVILPKCQDSPPASVPISAATESPSTLRALLVDDEAPLVEVTRALLTIRGYQVDAFHDPLQALECFQENPSAYDIALCDYSMPRMNGVALIKELHQLAEQLPCVLVTGNMDEVQADVIEQDPRISVLLKPYKHEELVSAMADVLPDDIDAD
ncbi:hybrid sensor histidine kinase/response regulator [Cerasicoccus maritimus]|uniref:hybrid sensor histidine kinase/response regulator n=1 Tax=Cerasicoccus maritimus TaxID=490089 RepID=UPI002852A7F5|nr:response regulator [Cerasicoccus maritimus]